MAYNKTTIQDQSTSPKPKTRLNILKKVMDNEVAFRKAKKVIQRNPDSWTKVKTDLQKELEEEVFNRVNFAYSLAELTEDNEPLTKSLFNKAKLNSVRDIALTHNKASLAKMITRSDWVPETIEGKYAQERKEKYAAHLINRLMDVAPAATIQRMVDAEELPISNKRVRVGVAKFFENQPALDLRKTTVESAIQHPTAFEGISESQEEKVIEELKILKSALETKPVADDLPVVFLMNKNELEPNQVTSETEDAFLKKHKKTLGLEWAKQVHSYAVREAVDNSLIPQQKTFLSALNAVIDDTKIAGKIDRAFALAKGNWPKAYEILEQDIQKDPALQQINFAHELVEITEEVVPLAKAIQKEPDINNLRNLALKHNKTSLTKLIKNTKWMPEKIEGKTSIERKKTFASNIINRVYHKETSATLRRMINDNELPIAETKVKDGVAQFLANLPDFNIRNTSVYAAFAQEHAFDDIAAEAVEGVMKEAKILQRVQAISTTTEAIPVLMQANLHSAHLITEMPKSSFVRAFGPKLGEATSRQIYKHAEDVKIRNEYALMSMREAIGGTGVRMIDESMGISDQQTLANLKKKLPISWEKLFGSVDFCECEHCNSVYGPAAYFVELLQYLRNNNLEPWNRYTGQEGIADTPLEQLFRRRPDLGELKLTCENALTVLPYVDLVNEVMESFVIHLDEHKKTP